MRILFENICILTGGEPDTVMNGYVLVDGAVIAAVGAGEYPGTAQADRVIDGRRKLLMPGFVNTHTHVPMTALRGFADDYVLQDWLHNHIFPVEARMDAEMIRTCTLLGLLDMLASGTTSFSDMYSFNAEIAAAVAEAGIKANISRGVTHPDAAVPFDTAHNSGWAETQSIRRDWNGYDNGRILVDYSVHAEYTTTPYCRRTVAEAARAENARLHLHLSETKAEQENCMAQYGKTPAALLYDEGLLFDRTNAAHCVWLTAEDCALFAECGVTLAHCPVSNLKLASGIAPVTALLDIGGRVTLGTDSVASNNSHDMFEEMKFAALLQKGTTGLPTVLPAGQVLRMATADGAAAQGRTDCGRIEAGLDADIVVLDTAHPSMTPCHNPVSAAVYSAHGESVWMTMVRGKILYENREFLTLDREKIEWTYRQTVVPRLFPGGEGDMLF